MMQMDQMKMMMDMLGNMRRMRMRMVAIDATIDIVDVFLFLHATRHIFLFL